MDNHKRVLSNMIQNIEQVMIGKRNAIELVLCALLCKGHVLVEDVPGVGKTSLVSALSKSLHCSFARIQFTPDILPSDITGFSLYNPKTGEFTYRKGAIMSQIILADEINRTSPKTQSSLLEAMEEKQVTVDGNTYVLPKPFMVLATQNPIEHVGTFPLPEAQLDRFFMKITLGYPERDEECKMLSRFKQTSPLETLESVASVEDILQMQQQVQEIYVDYAINQYIVSLVHHTRENEHVVLGASPRASICLFKAAQAFAYYQNRDFVLPDDVQKMAQPVLAHRIVMKQDAKFRNQTQNLVVSEALEQTQVPR